jgi:hypothetical protein
MTVRAMHVVPNNDLREHPTDTPTACPCAPVFDFVDGGGVIVVHNAWDKRELREVKATA